jgi:hypothetical protein
MIIESLVKDLKDEYNTPNPYMPKLHRFGI